MFKRFRFWLWTAAVLQILTAGIHAMSLFGAPTANNETEEQLFELMQTYGRDLGAGFHPTTWDLFIALSTCFTLVCLLGGLITIYLLKKRAHVDTLKGIVWINLFVFGICFAVMAALTFLPPIVLTGLIVVSILITLLTMPGKAQREVPA